MSRFWRHERGNIATLFAFGFTISAAVSAVAVDAASLYFERRHLQAGVDLAAISAASDPSRAAEIAQAVLVDARLLATASTDGLSVVTGRYDPAIADISARFMPGAVPANAVSVHLDRPGTLYFAAQLTGQPVLSAEGIAATQPEVAFSIGSRLASLNGGILNSMLSQFLGTTVSLSVMDYTALANAKIDALALLDALALDLGINAATYDELLELDVRSAAIARAMASLTTGAVRTALTGIAQSGQGNRVPLGEFLTLGRLGGLEPGSSAMAPDISLSAFDLISAAAVVADGSKQLALGVGVNVPGLTSLGVDLAVGEPPQGGDWFTIGPEGAVVRTAQTRLRIRSRLLGNSVLLGATVNLPLWLDAAYAEARVASATCPSPSAPRGSAVIDVRPGVVRAAVGDISDNALYGFGATPPVAPVRLVDVALLRITGSSFVEVGSTQAIPLTFSSGDIAAGTARTARTTTPVASLMGSLLSRLDIQVSVLGLGLASVTVITQSLRTLLAPLAAPLDLVIGTTLSTLGVGIGEADVRVYGVRCSTPVLVG